MVRAWVMLPFSLGLALFVMARVRDRVNVRINVFGEIAISG